MTEPTAPNKPSIPWSTRLKVAGVGALLVAGISYACSSGSSDDAARTVTTTTYSGTPFGGTPRPTETARTTAPSSSGPSIAYKLAVVDGKVPLDDSDDEVDPYRRDLTTLDSRCVETQTQLGDLVVVAKDQLANRALRRDLLDILDALVSSSDGYTGSESCTALMGSIVSIVN